MRITVHYMAQLKRAAGTALEEIDVDLGCTLGRLVRLLADRHDEGYRRLLLDAAGEVHKSLLFFIGDEQVRPEQDRALRERDVVTVLAPMSGG
jgi:molybdopterin converting factor small subunit